MVSFTAILAFAAAVLTAPTPDAAGLINANVDAKVGNIVDASADVNILPYYGPPYGYPGDYFGGYYPPRRGGLLDLGLGLSVLNGYGNGGLLGLGLGLNLLNGNYGYPAPRY